MLVFKDKENSLVARILYHLYSMFFSGITSGIVGKTPDFWLLTLCTGVPLAYLAHEWETTT